MLRAVYSTTICDHGRVNGITISEVSERASVLNYTCISYLGTVLQ